MKVFLFIILDELCTKQVFSTELVEGIPVDKCVNMDLKTREFICHSIMNLCLRELEFRFMQTDPNWSNFFYNQEANKVKFKVTFIIMDLKP